MVHLASALGGAERSLVNIVANLDRSRFPDISLVAPEFLRPHLASSRVHFLPVTADSVTTWFSTPHRLQQDAQVLSQILAEEQPQVVLGMMHYSAAVSVRAVARAALKCRLVASFRGPVYEYLRLFEPEPGRRRFIHTTVAATARQAHRIIMPSRGMKWELARRFFCPPWKARIVPNGIDVARITRAAAQPAEGMPPRDHDGVFELVAVARLAIEKRLDRVLRAVHEVSERLPVRLRLLGDGPDRTRLKSIATELRLHDRVHFLGFRDNVFPYLQRADCVVHSCEFEGFGYALVEAMACGTPVISEDCPYGPAEIIDGNRYGILVPRGDHQALAEAISKLAANPELGRQLAQRGRQRAAFYSVEKMVRSHERVLSET